MSLPLISITHPWSLQSSLSCLVNTGDDGVPTVMVCIVQLKKAATSFIVRQGKNYSDAPHSNVQLDLLQALEMLIIH